MRFYSKNQQAFVEGLFHRIRAHYGENLRSLAVFGSFARLENRLNSDLDVLIVLDKSPCDGRLALQEDFVRNIEMPLAQFEKALEQQGIRTEISNLIFTKSKAAHFNPLYLDMTEHVIIIFDRDDFLKGILVDVRAKMHQWGSVKKHLGGRWYWEIKPGLRWGETFDYDQ